MKLLAIVAVVLSCGACSQYRIIHVPIPEYIWQCHNPEGYTFQTDSLRGLKPAAAKTCVLVKNQAGYPPADDGARGVPTIDPRTPIVCELDGWKFTTDVGSAQSAGLLDNYCTLPA